MPGLALQAQAGSFAADACRAVAPLLWALLPTVASLCLLVSCCRSCRSASPPRTGMSAPRGSPPSSGSSRLGTRWADPAWAQLGRARTAQDGGSIWQPWCIKSGRHRAQRGQGGGMTSSPGRACFVHGAAGCMEAGWPAAAPFHARQLRAATEARASSCPSDAHPESPSSFVQAKRRPAKQDSGQEELEQPHAWAGAVCIWSNRGNSRVVGKLCTPGLRRCRTAQVSLTTQLMRMPQPR